MVTINAQKEKLIGSWLMVRAEIGGEIQEPYFIMDYKENGKTVAMEMELGTWKLDESSNTIIMESAFDKDFNGEAKIQKLTEEELIVIKDGAKLFYTRFNSDAIAGNNKKSKLFGIWETKNAEDETVLIKFEEPDSFVEITSGEGVTSRAAGSWVFNPEENYVIFIGFSHLLRGKNLIVELTEETLVLESNGTKINAKKTNSNSQIERLTFEYEDFPEESKKFQEVEFNFVSMGNPHAVGLVSSAEELNKKFLELGARIEGDTENFPHKINVNFVYQKGKNHFQAQTFERGVGPTLACGTGMCGTFAVLEKKLKKIEPNQKIQIDTPGGTLYFEFNSVGEILMTGPSELVFQGEIELEKNN